LHIDLIGEQPRRFAGADISFQMIIMIPGTDDGQVPTYQAECSRHAERKVVCMLGDISTSRPGHAESLHAFWDVGYHGQCHRSL